MIHLSHDMGGVATLLVNQRSHKGEYRLVIESQFNGLETNQYIKDMSVVEYNFEVEVVGETIMTGMCQCYGDINICLPFSSVPNFLMFSSFACPST